MNDIFYFDIDVVCIVIQIKTWGVGFYLITVFQIKEEEMSLFIAGRYREIEMFYES